MNKTKRLLSALLCVLMALSMFSTFAFADVVDTGADAVNSGVPEIDPLAENVFIYDSQFSWNDEFYSLVWNDEQYDGLPEDTKVFRDLSDLDKHLKSAKLDNAIVIVLNTTDLDQFKPAYPVSYYSLAYNTAPYIRGTAIDGSDWTVNPEFKQKAITIDKPVQVQAATYGEVNFYGFVFESNFVDTSRKTTELNVKFENCYFDYYATSNSAPLFSLTNTISKDKTSDDVFVVKNSFLSGSAKLFGATQLPAFITIDGLFIDPARAADVFSVKGNIRQDQNNSEFVIRNSNLSGIDMSMLVFLGDNGAITTTESRGLTFENNIINGVASGSTAIFPIQSTRYSSLKIKDNYISSNGSTLPLVAETYTGTAYKATAPLEVTITGNVLNGIDSEVKFVLSTKKADLRDSVLNLDKNYLTTTYAADLEGVNGTKLCATAHGITPTNYYQDYLKEVLVLEDIVMFGAEATNGLFAIDEPTRTIYYILNSGDATAVTFQLGHKDSYVQWYADKDCTTPIDPSEIKYEGDVIEYFLRVEKEEADGIIHGDVYSVLITRETAKYPFFITEFSDPVISNSAVLCDVASGYVTDGRLYAAEWNGKMYTFIKGVNVFDTIDAATIALRASGVERPQFMLKDLNGSKEMSTAWNVTLPADYFTENYANSPVIKGEKMDGSDWAYNEGTGAGQFDPAKTIRVLDIAFPANGVGGEYNFYGFTITRSVADWSRMQFEVKAHLVNCLFDITNWSAAHLFRADEYKYPAEAERFLESELHVKDSYFKTNGTVGRLVSGTLAADFRLDGILFDGPMGNISSHCYMQQVTYKSVFAIENSCFRNFNMTGIFYHEGMHNKMASNTTDKSIIVNNNTLVNTALSADAMIDCGLDYYNRVEFVGNKVYNRNPVAIVNYRSGGSNTGTKFTLIVKDNIVNAGKPKMTLAKRNYVDTVVTNNYVAGSFQSGDGVTYGGVVLQAIVDGQPVDPKSVSYLDSEMKLKFTDMQPYSIKGENVIYNKAAKEATVTVAPGGTDFFSERNINGTYLYSIDPSSVVDNPFGNVVKYTYGGKTETLGRAMSIFSTTQITLPIVIDISVSSPDGSYEPEIIKVTVTEDGPGIASVTVDGAELDFEDGAYAIELDARENGEAIEVVPVVDGTTITVKDGNTVLDNLVVDVNAGATKTYTLVAEYNGVTYTADLVVTRRPAEYDELEAAIEEARAIDMSRWLPKFAINLKDAIATYEAFDRETASQAEVDDLTQYILDTIGNFIERVEIDELVVKANGYKNIDGRYCPDTFAALKEAIATVGDLIPEIETQQQYDDAIAIINDAIDGLVLQKFETYVYDGNATVHKDGTETSKCELCGDTHTRTCVGSILSDWVWNEEIKNWNYYIGGKPAKNVIAKDTKGWCFVGPEGVIVYDQWVEWNEGWYYINAKGYALTNVWMQDSQGWLYLDSVGRMATKTWVKDSTGWMYLNEEGRITVNKWIEDSQGWCFVGEDGYCVTNTWVKDSVGWCYLDGEGRLATNAWVADSQGWCYVDAEGRMVYDMWVPDSTGMCYIGKDGYWDGRTAKFN